jgi:inner membrane protein
LVLWGAMLWFDRWQERRGKRPDKRLPVHKGWLLGLAYLGCLSHPLFDWFNSYGIRLLEPFSSQWFYGDTLFIIDIWIWAALIVGIWLSLRRERQNFKNVRRPAVISCLAVLVYISVNAGISNSAVSSTLEEIRKRTGQQYIEQIVANPVPIAFWQREVLFGSTNNYYRTEYSAFAARPVKVDVPQIEIGKHLPNIIEQNGKREAIVRDARFNNPLAQERFTVRMKLQGYEGSNDPSSLATCCASLDEAK